MLSIEYYDVVISIIFLHLVVININYLITILNQTFGWHCNYGESLFVLTLCNYSNEVINFVLVNWSVVLHEGNLVVFLCHPHCLFINDSKGQLNVFERAVSLWLLNLLELLLLFCQVKNNLLLCCYHFWCHLLLLHASQIFFCLINCKHDIFKIIKIIIKIYISLPFWNIYSNFIIFFFI